jgi:membrane peptidoglycan carboxypeptidase
MPLFDQLSEKAFNDFMLEYLVAELSTRQICYIQGISKSPSIYSLVKHSGTADEYWY